MHAKARSSVQFVSFACQSYVSISSSVFIFQVGIKLSLCSNTSPLTDHTLIPVLILVKSGIHSANIMVCFSLKWALSTLFLSWADGQVLHQIYILSPSHEVS